MRTARQRGAALLAVLWMTVALGFIAMALAGTVRTEVESARTLADSERGYFLARGALDAARLALASPLPPGTPIRRELAFEFETGSAVVEIQPESAKWDVRTAPVEVLAPLFQKLGLGSREASELALAIEERRGTGQPIRSLDDLMPLRHMTLDLFYGAFVNGRRPPLRDLLTFRSSIAGLVDVNFAHPFLLAALPGMSEERVARLVETRARKPFDSMAAVAELLPGADAETLRYLTIADAKAVTLIARGRAKGSDFERIVRLTYVVAPRTQMGYQIVDWAD